MSATIKPNTLCRSILLVLHSSLRGIWTSSTRLAINGGIVCETVHKPCPYVCYFPKNDWRSLTALESSLLISRDTLPQYNLRESMLLFSLPETLPAQFWDLDIPALFATLDTSSPEYESRYRMFLANVLNYMINDVGFLLTGPCSCTIAINNAGLRSTRYDPAYEIDLGLGTGPISPSTIHQQSGSQAVAYINLGDEAIYLSFINLTCQRMEEMLGQNTSFAGATLARRFLATFPTYPVLQLTIVPGEGIVLPVEHLIHDGSTLGKQEPDVLLKVHTGFAFESS